MINRDAASETRTHDSTGKHTDALIRSATATPFLLLCLLVLTEAQQKQIEIAIYATFFREF